jgi:hypothetical protein
MRSGLIAQEIANDLNASRAQHLNAAPLIPGMRIDERDVHCSDTPRNHLFGARWSALVERTRLERDKRRHVIQVALDLAQCHRLGVGLIGTLGKSAGNDRSIAHEHATHWWIWQAGWQRQFSLLDRLTHERFQGFAGLAHTLPRIRSPSTRIRSQCSVRSDEPLGAVDAKLLALALQL